MAIFPRHRLDLTSYARPGRSETDMLIAYLTEHRPDLTTYRERLAEAIDLDRRCRVVYRPPIQLTESQKVLAHAQSRKAYRDRKRRRARARAEARARQS